MSKRGFSAAALIATALALGGILLLLQQAMHKIPRHKLLTIFPFIEKRTDSYAITPQGLAFAEELSAHLRDSQSAEVYPLPVDAIFEIANPDSLHVPEYLFRLARNAGVQLLGLGVYGARGNSQSFEAQFQLFDRENREPILQHTFTPSPEAFAELRRGIFNALEAETSEPRLKAPATFQQDYYALALRFLRHEDIATEASAQAQRDTANSKLAELSARATLRHLRDKRAHEAEWNDSLEVLLPRLHRALRQDSSGVEAQLLLAQCFLQQKKWHDAEKLLRRARTRDPRHSKSYVYLAQLHPSRYAADGFDHELDLFQYALQLNPFDLEAVLGAADYLRLNLRKKEAVALLEKYRQSNPNHLAVLRALGRFYIMDSDMPNALALYEQIIRLDSQDANAFYNLGIVYYHHKDVDRAVQFFERAIKLADHADARLYLAYIAEQRGDIEKSIAYLRERIRLSTGEDDVFAAEARKQLYKALLRRGEIPKNLLPETLGQNAAQD